jgi:hypothetical protein
MVARYGKLIGKDHVVVWLTADAQALGRDGEASASQGAIGGDELDRFRRGSERLTFLRSSGLRWGQAVAVRAFGCTCRKLGPAIGAPPPAPSHSDQRCKADDGEKDGQDHRRRRDIGL